MRHARQGKALTSHAGVFRGARLSSLPTNAQAFNPFAPGDFAEKRVLKLVEWFSGHCRAIKG